MQVKRGQKSKLCKMLPADIYLFKFNNENVKTNCQIRLKLTRKTPDQRQWWCSYCVPFSSVYIVDFEQAYTSQAITLTAKSIALITHSTIQSGKHGAFLTIVYSVCVSD